MKKLTLVLLVFASIVLFGGCGDEDVVKNNNNNPGSTTGFDLFILNEGSAPGTGTLSVYKSGVDSMYSSIFGGSLSYPDGLYMGPDGLLVLEQGPNFGGNGKLYKLDINGNLINSSPAFGQSPYSLVSTQSKIYVTNGPGSSVTVLNSGTLNPEKSIPVGVFPQEILEWDNKIFVCNTSAFQGASDSTVSVITTVGDSVIATITLRKEPTSIFQKNGAIYVGCNSAGIIYKIDSQTLAKTDSFFIPSGFDKCLSYSSSTNSINFIDGTNNISQLDLSSRNVTTVVTNPDPVNNYFYSYNYIDKHYVFDAKNFAVNGKMYVYSNSGVLEKTFNTGIAPRRTVFIIYVINP